MIELEPDGNLNVLFPNKYNSKNDIKANTQISVPKDIGGFELKAREPIGESKIYALVTKNQLNLYTENNIGSMLNGFRSLKATETAALKDTLSRSLSIVPSGQGSGSSTANQADFGAQQIIIETVR
ncbi:MAG: DUF4384 domain-containing protein [Nitrospirae bacterium]|nr:DUF4384 domain-containing protein [Nitrospirota bacterium]